MKIKEEIYKGIKIEVFYNEEDDTFHASSLFETANDKFDENRKNFSLGFQTPLKAVENTKIKIDEFFKTTPKNYAELAKELTNYLTWDGYEDCHLEEDVVKILVENFIKLKNTFKLTK